MNARADFADVNGTRLFYEVSGAGPAVVLIHGFTLDHRMWREVVPSLAQHYTVLAYDVRGFGRSAPPVVSEPYQHRDDLRALLDQLTIERAHLIGHSVGGNQAMEFALTYPERARSWTGVCVSGSSVVPFSADLQALFAELGAAAAGGGVSAAKAVWRRAGWFAPAHTLPEVSAWLDEIVADYSGWHWQNKNPFVALDPPAGARLNELRLPALIVSGELDLPYNHEVASALHAGIVGAEQRVIAGAGHMAPMETPAALSQALLDFLAGNGS
jgi:3-oxoadipate enol-lactonase